jgi:prophage regulatory protein
VSEDEVFLRIKDVIARIPMTRNSIYRLVREGKFPRQLKVGGFASFWVKSEIDEWIAKKIAERK